MKVDIQLLLNICTFITSLIGLLTLLEMVKQRHASMMPNVLVQSPYLLTIKDEGGYGSPYSWTKENHNENMKEKFPYNIELVNVGLGTAVDIEYEWCFDIKYYMEKIPKDIQYNEEKNMIYFANKHHIIQTRGLKNSEYRIPFAQTSEKFQIEVLREFQCVFSAHLFSLGDKCEELGDSYIEFMNECRNYEFPLLIIKYNDISGKSYKKKFKFDIQPMMISKMEASFMLYINQK